MKKITLVSLINVGKLYFYYRDDHLLVRVIKNWGKHNMMLVNVSLTL